MRLAWFLVLLFGITATAQVDGLDADLSLDRSTISKAYFEGDFDLVVDALETFRKANPNPSREDRIFVYKYLSVIYAAKPETRAKAESFMYQLLKLMPSIELMDMYISDNIEAIFNLVRLRFEMQQRVGLDSGQSSPKVPPGASNTSARPPLTDAMPGNLPVSQTGKRSSAWIWWTAGGTLGLAAAVAGYVYLSESATSAKSSDTLVFR